jgi:hypothetical protein
MFSAFMSYCFARESQALNVHVHAVTFATFVRVAVSALVAGRYQCAQCGSHHAAAADSQPGSKHPAHLPGDPQTAPKQTFTGTFERLNALCLLHLYIQFLLLRLRFADFLETSV